MMPDDICAAPIGIIAEVRQFLADLRHNLPEVFNVRQLVKSASRTRRISYQGRHLELRIEQAPATGRSTIEAGDEELRLLLSPDDPRTVGAILEDWYRDRAREVLADRVAHWARDIGVRYQRIAIKDQRSLWGSCSPNSNLNFNWRLIMAPADILDYVVIHELCHLVEMNHSRRFWKLISRWCPEHKVHRRWLREYGQGLKKRVRPGLLFFN
ncbi:MAG: SprT family zinc-dependent metalloprotease [bacterium]